MLTRSAVVGGALWVAPTVTAVSLTPAHAATPSGVTPTQPPKEPPTEPPKEPPTDPPPEDSEKTPEARKTPRTPETPGTPTEAPSEKPKATTPNPSGGPAKPGSSGDAGGSVGSDPTAGEPLAATGADDVAMLAALGGTALVGGAAAVAKSKFTTPSASGASEDH